MFVLMSDLDGPHYLQEKNLAKAEGKPEPALYGSEHIRPLSIDDFKSAHEQVRNWFTCPLFIFGYMEHKLNLSLP